MAGTSGRSGGRRKVRTKTAFLNRESFTALLPSSPFFRPPRLPRIYPDRNLPAWTSSLHGGTHSDPKNTRVKNTRVNSHAPRLSTFHSEETRPSTPSNGIPKSRTSGNTLALAHPFLRDHPRSRARARALARTVFTSKEIGERRSRERGKERSFRLPVSTV